MSERMTDERRKEIEVEAKFLGNPGCIDCDKLRDIILEECLVEIDRLKLALQPLEDLGAGAEREMEYRIDENHKLWLVLVEESAGFL